MTADIRAAAQREAERRTIEPNVDDPLPVDHHTLGWRKGFRYGAVWGAARVTPTRKQLAKVLFSQRVSNHAGETAPEIFGACEEAADAILALIAKQTATKS